ncbi:hypothetical protein DSO57_1014570 [Entomophthora muscae]|uniref:Uncharacterized protein n=1 Tax=Entomophthora muscae TaxID=34485 RepID=A0ACC2SUB9_9FUNG|nr:hypothetical protein DSO57_1014570 [Entomophthora muscae]
MYSYPAHQRRDAPPPPMTLLSSPLCHKLLFKYIYRTLILLRFLICFSDASHFPSDYFCHLEGLLGKFWFWVFLWSSLNAMLFK